MDEIWIGEPYSGFKDKIIIIVVIIIFITAVIIYG